MKPHRTRDELLTAPDRYADKRAAVYRTCVQCGQLKSVSGAKPFKGQLAKGRAHELQACAECRKQASLVALRTVLFR